MKTFYFTSMTLIIALLIGCSSSKTTTQTTSSTKTNKTDRTENEVPPKDLADYLSRIPGLSVTGSGSSARVTMRGMNSMSTDTEPLFVVNGTPVNGGLHAASATVSVADIKSVRLLKSASETAFYGSRGSDGVILISLKY